METHNNKTSEKTAQNNTVNKPKIVKQKDKTVVGNSDRNKEKGTQSTEKTECRS